MNKNKKKFIDKLKKQSKDELITIICDLYEETFYRKKKIEKLQSLVFSHQQVVKSVLENQHIKFIYECVEEDDEPDESTLDKTKKESLKSYV